MTPFLRKAHILWFQVDMNLGVTLFNPAQALSPKRIHLPPHSVDGQKDCDHILETLRTHIRQEEGLDLPRLRNTSAGEQVAMVIAMVMVSHVSYGPLSSHKILSLPPRVQISHSPCTLHTGVCE